MRFSRFAPLALLPLVAGVAAACGSTIVDPAQAAGTTGSGGGATATASSSAVTTATASSSAATTASSSSGGTGGSDIGQPSDVYPAPHPAGPTVTTFGGLVLKTPKLYPIFFANEDPTLKMQVEDFDSKVGATQYWAATTAEYGVGPATSAAPIELADMPTGTLDDADIQTWLAGKINGDDPAFPADTSGIYILHYPAGLTVTSGAGTASVQQSCQDFGGYHSSIGLDGAHQNLQIAYAVVPRCDSFGQLSGIDAITGPESHELIEAVTDPFPMVSPAYADIDGPHAFWEPRFVGGGEVGDMCENRPDAFTKFAELPYTVQRTWSNKASLGGHQQCVPALDDTPYFAAVPVLTDNVKATVLGQPVYVKGVKIAVGMTKTIELDLFSDADTGGAWQVDAQDSSAMFGQPHLTLSLDQTSGQNGQKLHLTITVDSVGKNNTETFYVTSTLGAVSHSWLGIVGN